MPDTSLDRSSGALLGGRYRLVAEIGQGGMASVHRARDETLERPVAVKVMHPHLAADETFRDRFQREARAAAALSHPNVVTIHDTGEQGGAAYLVMELVEGESLRDLLDRRGRVTPAEALALLGPAAAGLGAAHAAGLVHRDVKPANVLYAADGTAKVTDFGLARAAAASTRTFDSGVIAGSPHYLSPEAVNGDRVDCRSDVYALGILLYECLTGRTPFQGDTPLATAVAHTRGTVPAPSAVVGDDLVPASVDEVVERATSPDREERYADATAFAAALAAAVPGGPAPVDLRGGDGDTIVLPADDMATTLTPTRDDGDPVRDGGGRDGRGDGSDGDDGGGGGGGDDRGDGDADGERSGRFRRGRRWGLLALLVGVVGAFLVWDQVVAPVIPIPEVVDLPRAEAVRALEQEGLVAHVADRRPNHLQIPEGEVVAVRPTDTARRGDTVTLVLSAGPPDVEVPDVRGSPQAEAVTALEDTDLVPDVEKAFHQEVESGRVITTRPSPGTTVEATSTVTVRVSRGREPVEVPDVVDKEQQDALTTLGDAGLAPEVTGRSFSEEVPEGRVVGQSPAAGTEVFRGDRVEVVVSKGPPPFPMPNVEGSPQQRAEKTLDDAGLEVEVVQLTNSDPRRSGRVDAQDPPPGTEVRRGRTVTIFVWE